MSGANRVVWSSFGYRFYIVIRLTLLEPGEKEQFRLSCFRPAQNGACGLQNMVSVVHGTARTLHVLGLENGLSRLGLPHSKIIIGTSAMPGAVLEIVPF